MKTIRTLSFLLTIVLACSLFASAQNIPAGSIWKNQRGSTLYINSIGPDGMISGYYINRASGFSCQNTPYAVTGWTYENTITFAVAWKNGIEDCHSQTAWTGVYLNGQISTKWNLAVQGSSTILSGTDTFVRTQTKHSSFIQEE